jgi:parvulin-like peptidyl-prolyl isomerase
LRLEREPIPWLLCPFVRNLWVMNFSFLLPLSLLSIVIFTPPAKAELVDRLDAIVNKKPIFKTDADKFRVLIPLRQKVDPLFNNDPISKKANLTEKDIVEFLIDEDIIVEKYPVADPEVEQEITGIQSNLHIDREALRAAIMREGFKFEDYFQLMRVSISKRQLIDHEIRNKATVSDDDLRSEYNRQESGSKEFHGSFHLFIMNFSKSRYKTAKLAHEEALKAEADLKAKKTFEEVAKDHSDDETAAQGGDLGFLAYSEMSPGLQTEVRKLGANQVSGVIDEGKNYKIIKVAEIKSDSDAAYDKDKEKLRGKILESEFGHQIQIWLDRERSLNNVKVNI